MDAMIKIPSSEFNEEIYLERLSRSVTDIEQGKGIVFTMDELENYIHELPGK